MKKQFVTKEIALKLKELGYNDPCLSYFRRKTEELSICMHFGITNLEVSNNEHFDGSCTSPLWQQAADWLRLNHRIVVTESPSQEVLQWFVHDIKRFQGSFTKEQAFLKAISLIKGSEFPYKFSGA